jgi:hypothetical protein
MPVAGTFPRHEKKFRLDIARDEGSARFFRRCARKLSQPNGLRPRERISGRSAQFHAAIGARCRIYAGFTPLPRFARDAGVRRMRRGTKHSTLEDVAVTLAAERGGATMDRRASP